MTLSIALHIAGIFIYFIIVWNTILEWNDFECFNPIRNYKQWKNLNWFGVALGTIFLNLFYFPISITYWLWKLCTIGRK